MGKIDDVTSYRIILNIVHLLDIRISTETADGAAILNKTLNSAKKSGLVDTFMSIGEGIFKVSKSKLASVQPMYKYLLRELGEEYQNCLIIALKKYVHTCYDENKTSQEMAEDFIKNEEVKNEFAADLNTFFKDNHISANILNITSV